MARRRTRDPQLSLFPFLSVLAAVMGTLILIIAGMSQIALANPKQSVEVEPFDPGRKSPIYVECRGDGVLIYPDEPSSGPPTFVKRDELAMSDSPMDHLIGRLRYDGQHYLFLLVRAEGVGAYTTIRQLVHDTGIDVGFDPLFGNGAVRFKKKHVKRREGS